jgi:hypothetical protein
MKVCLLVCMWEIHLMMVNELHDRRVCGLNRRFWTEKHCRGFRGMGSEWVSRHDLWFSRASQH